MRDCWLMSFVLFYGDGFDDDGERGFAVRGFLNEIFFFGGELCRFLVSDIQILKAFGGYSH